MILKYFPSACIWRKTIIQKDICYLNIHCYTIYNSQGMEATSVSINWWRVKKDMLYLHNEMSINHK